MFGQGQRKSFMEGVRFHCHHYLRLILLVGMSPSLCVCLFLVVCLLLVIGSFCFLQAPLHFFIVQSLPAQLFPKVL